ncbi:MAG: hypothetical protein ACLR6I_07905 [Waltera sp.]
METAGLEEKLWAYAESVIGFYKPYYRGFAEENSVGLPDEMQLALGEKQQNITKSGQDQKSIGKHEEVPGHLSQAGKEVMLAYAEMVRNEIAAAANRSK